VENLLKKYTNNLLLSQTYTNGNINDAPQSGKPWSVILTGTTGSLGSHLLSYLDSMLKSKVARIFCFNRTADAEDRQRNIRIAHGLTLNWADNQRTQFLHADFARQDLGLDPETYKELADRTTLIIHLAWPINFNLDLEPHIRGVRNLLGFAEKSRNKSPLIFASSISTAFGWSSTHPGEEIPEAVIDLSSAPDQIGYRESKFIAEHLLSNYSKFSGLKTAILRIGQIAGPLKGNGVWSKQEWFPSMMASSKHLDMLPKSLGNMGRIDWIPVDILSSVIV
jgi:thioester reductase-like protein